MKSLISLMTAVVLAAVPLLAEGGHDHHDHSEKAIQASSAEQHEQLMEVTGEILDMNCYMTHDAKGAKHAKCAKTCALKGAPLGLLDDKGVVHLLVADHANEAPMKQAQKLAGEKVKISGKVSEKGGLSAIVLSSVEKTK